MLFSFSSDVWNYFKNQHVKMWNVSVVVVGNYQCFSFKKTQQIFFSFPRLSQLLLARKIILAKFQKVFFCFILFNFFLLAYYTSCFHNNLVKKIWKLFQQHLIFYYHRVKDEQALGVMKGESEQTCGYNFFTLLNELFLSETWCLDLLLSSSMIAHKCEKLMFTYIPRSLI